MAARDEKPIFLFALPRSGSTLAMRLANRCGVCMRGENKCALGHYESLLEQFRWFGRFEQATTPLAELEERSVFPSMFNELDEPRYLDSLAESFKAWINPPAGRPWGFKETNHGLGGPERFAKLAAFCRELFPGVRIWVHLRDTNAVVQSMRKCPSHWFGSCPRKMRARIVRQREAFESLAIEDDSVLATYYSQLLNIGQFRDKIAKFGLEISEDDYRATLGKVLK